MSLRLSKFLIFILVLAGLPLSAHAQRGTLPPLRHTATDATGILTLFYPENWNVETGGDGQIVLHSDDDLGGGILLRGQVMMTDPLTLEDITDWLVENEYATDDSFFSAESYAGFEGWLAQGEGILRSGVFSAALALQIRPQRLVLIQSDFPAEQLSDNAALITAILSKMVILPAVVETDTLSVNLPQDWVRQDVGSMLLAGAENADVEAMFTDSPPQKIGVSIRFFTQAASLEEVLQSATAIVQETREFEVNGIPAVLQVRTDNTNQTTEVVIVRQRGADAFVEVRAVSTDPRFLVDYIPILQAVFSSVRLQ